jgi:hypothetical protein
VTVTSSSGTNTYTVIWGQAVLTRTVSDSTTWAGATTTTSHSETNYSNNGLGQLTGGTGTNSSTTWSTNADGTVAVTTASGTTSYASIWGQAAAARSLSNSMTTAGMTTTRSYSDTTYSYNGQGQLTGGYGSNSSETSTTNTDGTVTVTNATGWTQFGSVWGQAVAFRTVSNSTTSAGSTQTTAQNDTSYAYNWLGQLSGASGTTSSTTRTTNDDGTVAVTNSSGYNVYGRILWGQAVSA